MSVPIQKTIGIGFSTLMIAFLLGCEAPRSKASVWYKEKTINPGIVVRVIPCGDKKTDKDISIVRFNRIENSDLVRNLVIFVKDEEFQNLKIKLSGKFYVRFQKEGYLPVLISVNIKPFKTTIIEAKLFPDPDYGKIYLPIPEMSEIHVYRNDGL